MYTVKDIVKAKQHPEASKDSQGRLVVGAAIGAGGDFLERAKALIEVGCDVLHNRYCTWPLSRCSGCC